MLVRTGSVVVLVLANVPGFRLVLARGWHVLARRPAQRCFWPVAGPVSIPSAGSADRSNTVKFALTVIMLVYRLPDSEARRTISSVGCLCFLLLQLHPK